MNDDLERQIKAMDHLLADPTQHSFHVKETMRLASLLATARCVRLKQKEKGPVEAAQAEVRVAKATEALRSYVQYVVDQIPITKGEAP